MNRFPRLARLAVIVVTGVAIASGLVAQQDSSFAPGDATDVDYAAGVATVGKGWSGTATVVPQLLSTRPVINGTVTIMVAGASASSSGHLCLSGPGAVPYALDSGAFIYIDLSAFVVAASFDTDKYGQWMVSVPFNVDPSLAGQQVMLQAVIWPDTGFELSNALLWTLGS